MKKQNPKPRRKKTKPLWQQVWQHPYGERRPGLATNGLYRWADHKERPVDD